MNYWLRRLKICTRFWARKLRYERFATQDGISAVKIFIYVAFGFLLGWHTTNLQVKQCEAEMERHIQSNNEMILQITEEHSKQLQQQRAQYQQIIGVELNRMGQAVEESRVSEKRMLKNQAEIKNELELDNRNCN